MLCMTGFKPLPKDIFLTLQNWKRLKTAIFKFDENGRKFSKWIENTMGKGEIAHYKQLLHFPQCFQKTSTGECKNQHLFGKGLSPMHAANNAGMINLIIKRIQKTRKKSQCRFFFFLTIFSPSIPWSNNIGTHSTDKLVKHWATFTHSHTMTPFDAPGK